MLFVFGIAVAGYGQRTTKEKPKPKTKPSASPAPAKTARPTIEMLTSVSQVTDVKPDDPQFEALRSLIERYGISGLTRNKTFNGSANLTGSDFEMIDRSVRQTILSLLSAGGYDPAAVKRYEPVACLFNFKRQTFTEIAVADHLQCAYIPGVLAKLDPTAKTLSRSRFVIFLDKILDSLTYRLGELESMQSKAVEPAKAPTAAPTPTQTPTPTPTPRPPVKLIELSNRPGDFWNFIPGTWDAELSTDGKKSPQSRWKFARLPSNDFTLTMDANSATPVTVMAWAVRKAPVRVADPAYHTINFDYSGYRFDGYIAEGGVLKGNIYKEGSLIGKWTAFRRLDLDYADLGADAKMRKSNEEAIGYYSKAIKAKPLADHLLNRGNLYYAEKQYELAVSDYSQAIMFSPSSEALYNRSLAFYNLRRYRESADDATRIITQYMPALTPKRRADVLVRRGLSYIGLNDKNAAAADLREALRHDPGSAAAKKALADLGVQP